MKKLILLLIFTLSSTLVMAQMTTANPDTVCYQTPGSIYQIQPLGAGYTYVWTATAPGVIVSGQGTSAIGVDWSAANPGLIPNGITVTVTSQFGCVAQVLLDIFILNVVSIITPIGPYCETDPCVLLTAIPAGGTFSGTGVVGNTFCPNIAGSGTFNITYTYTTNGCTFTATIPVTVYPIPTLTPIDHN